MPSVTAWSVWDLPLWTWRGYVEFHDDYVKQAKEAADR